MSAEYNELLDATIRHLESLKARGVRHIAVAPETLRSLVLPARPVIENFQPQTQPAMRAPGTLQANFKSLPVRAETALGAPASAPKSGLATAAVVAPPPPFSPEKSAAFAALRERALACVKCPNLAASRKNVVFGVGNMDAQLMFVGEAPGADEDLQGEPFVGAAGQLLTKIISATGLSRAEVYIANILKCRPDMPAGSSGNRKPTPAEMATCLPYLHEQIDLIKPKVLVALGGTAMEGLLGLAGITKLRGQWHEYRGIPLMPTFHPSYLLRPDGAAHKRQVWEDVLQVMEKLGLPISDKQRKFFLKP